MANRFEKNYYATLGVPEHASQDELRKAYRDLAKRFHPDAAPDNPFAELHFAAISEAYEVLSNPASRAAYDEQRWLRGFSKRSHAARRITPQWIKAESARLRDHMSRIDTYRMDHAALRDYVAALLSDEHLSILRSEAGISQAVFDNVLISVSGLRHTYVYPVAQRLAQLANGDSGLIARIAAWEHTRSIEQKWNRYRPAIIIAATLLMCVLLWWLSQR